MSDYNNIREDSIEEQQRENFDRLWRDELAHIPPLDEMPLSQCNPLKQWAWEVYQKFYKV